MMNVIRLFLLFVLSFQTATFSWAITDVPTRSLQSSHESYTDPLYTGIDSMAHEANSMAMPCDLADSETCDTASDEGLRENLHFNLCLEGNKTILPRSEQWYNFFRQYSIPPPESL